MAQNDPRAEDNKTIKRKNRKNIFRAVLGVFVHFCSLWGHFRGSENRKNFEKIFFSGIDLEWSETHFKPKISRKNFSSSFKFFKMAIYKFSGQFEGSKAGKNG